MMLYSENNDQRDVAHVQAARFAHVLPSTALGVKALVPGI